METRLQLAAQKLADGGHTLYAFCDGWQHVSNLRGVAPLLGLLDSGITLDGCAVADKVVGKAAAFLHVLLGTQQLVAGTISRSALQVLQSNGVYVDCDRVVDAIINRAGDGYCPLEQAVWDETSPTQALQKIKEKLAELQSK